MTMALRPVTPDNVAAACRIEVRPEQAEYVASVAFSLAEAYVHPDKAWPRLVYDGDEPVAFIMAGFAPDAPDHSRCGIWRLNVAAVHQGKGYGTFAVHAVRDEARGRGEKRLTVRWKPGAHSPEPFYLRLGFRPTGVVIGGETVGELLL